MKIVMIDPLGSEGQAMYDYALCNGLAQMGNDVIFVSAPEFRNNFKIKHYGFRLELILKHHRNKRKNLIIRILSYAIHQIKLFALIKKEGPDIIHYQFLFFPLIDIVLMKFSSFFFKKKSKLVFTAHDVRETTGSFIKSFLRKNCIRIFDGVWVHSEITASLFKDYISNYNGLISIIPHGNYIPFIENNVKISKSEARTILNIPHNKKVILFLGSILEYKGLDILINAFASAVKINTNLHLLIGGSTRNLTFYKYELLIDRNNITSNVSTNIKYLNDNDIMILLGASDILALPYRECYTPGVAHLGQSYGIPIIASNVGALKSIIKHNETGIIVDSLNPSDWAKKIVELSYDENILDLLCKNAKQYMVSEHSWDVVSNKAYDFYRLI